MPISFYIYLAFLKYWIFKNRHKVHFLKEQVWDKEKKPVNTDYS